jgi:Na+/proline symporter
MIDPVAATLVAIYFIAMVGIGVWASKKIHNMSDYVVAGRSLDFWVFTMLMIGSVCSGMYHILRCQDAYCRKKVWLYDGPGLPCPPL